MTPRWQLRAVHGMVHAVISRSLSQRRLAVGVSFVAAVALVVILNRRSSGAADGPDEPRFHFTNIAHEAGIDFVHHGPTLDRGSTTSPRSSARWVRPSRYRM